MGAVSGAIGIKDNATSVLKRIRTEQTAFRKDVEKTRKELTATWEKKHDAKLETTSATKKMNALQKKMSPFRKKLVKTVAIRDNVTEKIKSVSGKVRSLGKMATTPVVKLKDGVSGGIGKIKSSIGKIAKKVVIPVTVAATVATAVLGGAVKSGMQLENQQVSMKHFIGATNKDMDAGGVQKVADEFTSALRENANATPFETGDVIASGTRALSIASGNTKGAMSLVKLAEDMSAASGGTKSISDAMEALADAKMGEGERLKEFGFKVSADEFQQKGFAGVSGDLQDFYGGAAEKLAKTGSGLMSTIKGKLKSNFADFGLSIVNKMKPVFENVIAIIDKSSPALEKFGSGIADKVGKGIEAVAAIVPSLISQFKLIQPIISSVITGFAPMIPQLAAFGGSIFSAVQQIATAAMPIITTIISTIQTVLPAVLPVLQTVIGTIGSVISQAAPIISGLVTGIGTVISTLAPIFTTIFSAIGEKVGSVIGFVSERMGFVQEIISTAAPVIGDILTTAWGVISPIMDIACSVFKVLFSVVQKVFPGIQKVMQGVWKVIKPVVEGLGWVVKNIAGGFSFIADKITGGGEEAGSNAKGSNNWRGGVTWVGEKGPELVNLPKGSRILPKKESVAFANSSRNTGAEERSGYTAQSGTSTMQTMRESANMAVGSILSRIDMGIGQIISILSSNQGKMSIPQYAYARNTNAGEGRGRNCILQIAKLADSIIVREEGDIEEITDKVAKKIKEVIDNM